jgi:hypothetical protein
MEWLWTYIANTGLILMAIMVTLITVLVPFAMVVATIEIIRDYRGGKRG